MSSKSKTSIKQEKATLVKSSQTSDFSIKKLYVLLIPIFIFIIYSQTSKFDYTGDDILVTTGNSYVQKGFLGISDIFSHSYMHGYTNENDPIYRPLPLASYAIEGSIFGYKSSTHHNFNILFYIFCCMAFYYFLRLLKFQETSALLIALIFTCHPIHTEVVANIKSRDEILAFLGLMIMLISYFKNDSTLRVTKWTIFSAIGFMFALLSKEIGVSFIILAPLIDYFYNKESLKNILYKSIPFFICVIVYFSLRSFIDLSGTEKLTLLENSMLEAPNQFARIPTAFYILCKYILLILFPVSLSYDYSYNQIPLQSFGSFGFILAIMIIILMLLISFIYRNKNSWALIGVLWFFITISIVSNILFLTGATMAERFLFTPIAGIIIALISTLDSSLIAFNHNKNILIVLSTLFLILFTYQSYSRTKVWKNDKSLFQSGIKSAPNSARTNMFYGKQFYNDAKKNENPILKNSLIDSSILYYNKAISIYPKFTTAYHFLGWAYREKNLTQEERNAYINSFKQDSTYYPALISQSIIELKANNFIEAIKILEYAKKIAPQSYDIEYNLGLAYRGNKQIPEAVQSNQNAHAINNKREEPISQLIKIYRDDLNKIDSALYYNELIKKLK